MHSAPCLSRFAELEPVVNFGTEDFSPQSHPAEELGGYFILSFFLFLFLAGALVTPPAALFMLPLHVFFLRVASRAYRHHKTTNSSI